MSSLFLYVKLSFIKKVPTGNSIQSSFHGKHPCHIQKRLLSHFLWFRCTNHSLSRCTKSQRFCCLDFLLNTQLLHQKLFRLLKLLRSSHTDLRGFQAFSCLREIIVQWWWVCLPFTIVPSLRDCSRNLSKPPWMTLEKSKISVKERHYYT